MPTVTVSTTQEVKIAPQTRTKLLKKLRAYQELSHQIKALEHAKDKIKDEVDEMRAETGQQSMALEGFTITQVAGVRKVFDKKAFVQAGGDLQVYENAHVLVPSKPYAKITTPGAVKDEE